MASGPGARGRRIGREGILDVAADMLAAARLRDVAAVLGMRRVAEAAGVAPGTITHHFGRADPDGPQSLPAATIRHALQRDGFTVSGATRDGLEEAAATLRTGDRSGLQGIVETAAESLIGYGQANSAETAMHLAVAVAPADPVVARIAAEYYEQMDQVYPGVYTELAEATGRRFIAEFSAADFAKTLTALIDGFAIRERLRPDPKHRSTFASAAMALFETVTVPLTDDEPPPPEERIMPLPNGSTLDPVKRTAIARATVEVYEEQGWDAVTVAGVARRAGVSRALVASHFGDRAGLAAAVWAPIVSRLGLAIAGDVHTGESLETILWRHGLRLIETARLHPLVTAKLIEGLSRSRSGRREAAGGPADVQTIAPVHALGAEQIYEHRDLLKSTVITSPADAATFAGFFNRATLNFALNEPDVSATRATDLVISMTLDGILARPS